MSWQWVDGSDDAWYLGSSKPDPLPVGVIGTTYSRKAILWQRQIGGDGRCNEQALQPTPSDVTIYSWEWNRCSSGGGDTVSLLGNGWQIKPETLFDRHLIRLAIRTARRSSTSMRSRSPSLR